jgi:hypothetical protein
VVARTAGVAPDGTVAIGVVVRGVAAVVRGISVAVLGPVAATVAAVAPATAGPTTSSGTIGPRGTSTCNIVSGSVMPIGFSLIDEGIRVIVLLPARQRKQKKPQQDSSRMPPNVLPTMAPILDFVDKTFSLCVRIMLGTAIGRENVCLGNELTVR